MAEAPSLFEIVCLVRDEARKSPIKSITLTENTATSVAVPQDHQRGDRSALRRGEAERSGCPHAVIQGVELYADEHLIELARRLLDDAKLVAA